LWLGYVVYCSCFDEVAVCLVLGLYFWKGLISLFEFVFQSVFFLECTLGVVQ